MIPKNICRIHVLRAIEEITKNGVPQNRGPTKYQLLFEGRHYPPKYVVALANEYANGHLLGSNDFGGGTETNNFLRNLGFEIIDKTTSGSVRISHTPDHRTIIPKPKHDERCQECKVRIEQLLIKLYGRVIVNYKFNTNVRVEDLKNPDLNAIHKALSDYRGHGNFIKADTLPSCDFYMPEKKILVEFDESQHFTRPRMIALQHYPKDIQLGYDKTKWINLCSELDKKDNDPPYRDEQRAWYDTIRDFLTILEGINPIIRIYARELKWCGMNPDNQIDIEKFKMLVENNIFK